MPTWTFKNRKGTVFKANKQKIEVLPSKFALVNDFFSPQQCFSQKRIAHLDNFCQFLPNQLKG
jgi:hypothetical protein